MAVLRDLAGGRADLLAEVAGVMEGFAESELDERSRAEHRRVDHRQGGEGSGPARATEALSVSESSVTPNSRRTG